MENKTPYFILAYYHFSPIDDPNEEVNRHKEFFENRDVSSRIYISEDGINGQMCGSKSAAEEYMEWMHSREAFAAVHFKIHRWHEHVFPRKTVKYRKNLVAYGKKVNLSNRGEHIPPKKWREMLESEREYHLLDVRNDYEWNLGHFDKATLPDCKTFREFEEFADQLKQEKDPKKTPVMMYCTGGIRCELYSSILKEKGFDEVYQLEGGIINYGLEEGSKHWRGKLFVFDDRLSIPISEGETPVVGKCYHCNGPTESYYNCANMDCNCLFLCCHSCLKGYSGCCREECCLSERLRPYQEQHPHKPFRKKHHYAAIPVKKFI